MTSKKKKISSEIETELQCKATASLDGEVIDDLSAEDKSMAEFFKELGELGEDEQEQLQERRDRVRSNNRRK